MARSRRPSYPHPMAIKQNDRFALTRNWRGSGAAHFEGNRDREFVCLLEKGTVLVATHDVGVMATGVRCAVDGMADRLDDLVPAEIRVHPASTGVSFVFFTVDIGALLTVETNAAYLRGGARGDARY